VGRVASHGLDVDPLTACRTFMLSKGGLLPFMQSQWQVVSGTWKTLSPGSPSRLFTFLGESPGRFTTMSIAFFLRRSTRSASLGTNLKAIRWKYGSGRCVIGS